MLSFNVAQSDVLKLKGDLAVFYAFENMPLSETAQRLDALLAHKLTKAIKDQRFIGKEKETIIFDAPEKLGYHKIVIIGLGERSKLSIDGLRLFAAIAIDVAKQLKLETVVSQVPVVDKESHDVCGYALFEGAFLANYSFKGIHKEPKKKADTIAVKLFVIADQAITDAKKLIKKADVVHYYVNMAKDLVNLPPNVVTPSYLEKVARDIAKSKAAIKLKILSYAEAKKLGMGGFCGVAQGTNEPPKFIVLEYNGGGKEKVALVGKGITFDSGGISLKPADGMMEMKTDMAGAALVLASFAALIELGVKKHLFCIVPATENLPSGTAYKPADVIKTYSGRTVEINSTDAEGRMVLCDALTYAQELGAERIIDYATLTGACQIALGNVRAGVMTNSQRFLDSYLASAVVTGEKHWQLPMDEEYAELLKSDTADTLNNAKKRYAGTISAAKFLESFINKGTEWIHCDIAGTAYLDSKVRYINKMATGFAIRTLVEYLL